jgi:hypothetical protein
MSLASAATFGVGKAMQVGSRLLKVNRLTQNPKGGRYMPADVAKRGRQAAAQTYRSFNNGPLRKYDLATKVFGYVETINWGYKRATGRNLVW